MKFFSATFALLALLVVINVGIGSAGRQLEEYWGAAMGGEAMPAIIRRQVVGGAPSDQKFMKTFNTTPNVIVYHPKKFLKDFNTASNVIIYHAKNHPEETARQTKFLKNFNTASNVIVYHAKNHPEETASQKN